MVEDALSLSGQTDMSTAEEKDRPTVLLYFHRGKNDSGSHFDYVPGDCEANGEVAVAIPHGCEIFRVRWPQGTETLRRAPQMRASGFQVKADSVQNRSSHRMLGRADS